MRTMRTVKWIGVWCFLAICSLCGAWAVDTYVVGAFPYAIQEEQVEDYVPELPVENDPSPTPQATEFLPAAPHKAPTPTRAPDPPRIEVQEGQQDASEGNVRIGWNESLTPYTVFAGSVKYPHEIVREVLEQQQLGHLEYSVSIPGVQYRIVGEPISDTQYRIDPDHVSLLDHVVVPIAFSMRYPILSDEQFAFLSDKTDYRFVYGLFRGVVEHEEMHLAALRTYAKEIETILARPLVSSREISASSKQEFYEKAGDVVREELIRRLDAAQGAHDQKQYAIDNPAENPIIRFEFEEEVNSKVPPTLVAEFQGVATFSFTRLPSPPPRPPKPTL